MKTKWNLLLILALLVMLVGASAHPAQAQTEVYTITGQVWNDGNQDGVWDDIEDPFNSMWVGLDPGCDGAVTPDLYFPLVSGGDGWFTFADQPAGASYCVYGYGFWVDDFRVLSEPAPFLLTGDVTGKNIAVTSNWITLSDTGIPAGQYNEPYFHETTVWGGTGPFTLTGTYTMPAGMSYSLEGRILTLSGTPTQVGGFADGATVVDTAGHEYTTLRFMVYGDAEFNLTSTPNPAALGQAVSFTFSASDPNFPDKPPYGLVTFYADETPIEGCTNVYLNVVVVDGQPALGDFPAVCQTDALAAGNHTIRADFASYSAYYDTSLTLACGQTVGAAASHCISGYLFHDGDGDGIFDPEGWDADQYNSTGIIYLDQDCDGQDYDEFDAWVYTGEDGSFTFSGLPDGETFCVAPHLSLGYEMTTAAIRFDALAADQTGLMIGMRHIQFVLDRPIPDFELDGAVNESFTVTGGQAPYAIAAGEIELPPGMTWSFDDIDTLTLSGTADMIGNFFFGAWFTDANGVEDELQTFILVRGDADMKLESSANPSEPGEPVTFTFTANRPDLTWPDYLSPTGTVTFSADGMPIADSCTNIPIYFEWVETNSETGDGYYVYHNTATCTATLAGGSHGISAVFDNHEAEGTFDYTSPYHDGTLTLTQVVGTGTAAPVVTFTFVQPEPSLAGYPILRHYIYFTGTAGDGNYSCTVDYGDGTGALNGRVEDRNGVDKFICDDYTPYHIFANPGTYTITYTIHDIYGNETIYQVEHTVIADQDLGLFTWSPMPAVVNQPLTLTTTQPAQNYMWLLASGPGIAQPMEIGYGPTVTFTPPATGTYKVELFLVDVDGMDISVVPDGAEIEVVEDVQADLSISKTDSKDPVKPGAQLVYTLTVSNLGPNTAESVVLADKLDANTTYVSTSAPKGWKCSFAKNSATVTCTTSGLASGSSATIKITVTVNKTAKVGKELVNNATVSSLIYDPVLINNTVVQKTMVAK